MEIQPDLLTAVVTAIVGGGGIFSFVKVWLTTAKDREERADKRLDTVLDRAQTEREKDREKDREERLSLRSEYHATLRAMEESFTSRSERIVAVSEALVTEIRKLRGDQRAGLACRFGEPSNGSPMSGTKEDPYVATPLRKADGTRGG